MSGRKRLATITCSAGSAVGLKVGRMCSRPDQRLIIEADPRGWTRPVATIAKSFTRLRQLQGDLEGLYVRL